MAKKKTVEVRVLTDVVINGVKLPCGAVAVIGDDHAKSYVDSLDVSVDAVAHAKAEGASIIDVTAEESLE